MLREVRDELVDLRLVGTELARVLGDRGEAVHVARLLHRVEQEVEHDEVEVLDLVGAGVDELPRAHVTPARGR